MKETGRVDALQTAKADARAEGEAIGEARGRAEGKAEGIHLVAKNLIQTGMSIEQIMAATQLSKDIIVQIKYDNSQ